MNFGVYCFQQEQRQEIVGVDCNFFFLWWQSKEKCYKYEGEEMRDYYVELLNLFEVEKYKR